MISLKKEMRAGSVLSSVAIMFHESGGDLDLAVRLSVEHIRQLVEVYDTTATMLLFDLVGDQETCRALTKVIDLFRMVNTGNLEWR